MAEKMRSPVEHEIKVWPLEFQATIDGLKPFEYRKDDRGYQVGDTLWQREWGPPATGDALGGYTGRENRVLVTFKIGGQEYGGRAFGVPANYCVMGIKPVIPPDPVAETALVDIPKAAASIAGMVDEYTARGWNDEGRAQFAHMVGRRFRRFIQRAAGEGS